MWHDLGPIEPLMPHARTAATTGTTTGTTIGTTKLVITHVDGEFGALSGVSRYAGGPLAEGQLDSAYIVCPWHCWKYHDRAGRGARSFEADALPRYDVKTENARIVSSDAPPSKRARDPRRVLGISTTNRDIANSRSSTSDALLGDAVAEDWTSTRGDIASLQHARSMSRDHQQRQQCHAYEVPCV